MDNLPLRPIISNIGTAFYQLAKYLAKLLFQLAQFKYTINSTKDLVIKIKNDKIPENYKMVPFDLKSLFTLVPLEHTIGIIIKIIYEKHETTTLFAKNEMKKLLVICTKNVHFSFNNDKNYLDETGKRKIERAADHCKITNLTYLNMH